MQKYMECSHKATEAIRLYKEKYPSAPQPAKSTPKRLFKVFTSRGNMANQVPKTKKKTVLTPANLERIQNLVDAEGKMGGAGGGGPRISCRRNGLGISKSSFYRALRQKKIHPSKTQGSGKKRKSSSTIAAAPSTAAGGSSRVPAAAASATAAAALPLPNDDVSSSCHAVAVAAHEPYIFIGTSSASQGDKNLKQEQQVVEWSDEYSNKADRLNYGDNRSYSGSIGAINNGTNAATSGSGNLKQESSMASKAMALSIATASAHSNLIHKD